MEHFQTLDDLREYVKSLQKHIKEGDAFCARPTASGKIQYSIQVIQKNQKLEASAKKIIYFHLARVMY